jgi:hypothetical protein
MKMEKKKVPTGSVSMIIFVFADMASKRNYLFPSYEKGTG